jgi:cysteinyl-tRNA synthetase
MSGMKTSVRVNNDEYEKESAADFVLWKAWKESDGANFWEEEFEIAEKKITLK